MAISGYLIQVAATPFFVSVFIWTHVVTSALFFIGYTVHLSIGYRLTRLPTGTPDTAVPGPARLSL